jgi:hypothetical protein
MKTSMICDMYLHLYLEQPVQCPWRLTQIVLQFQRGAACTTWALDHVLLALLDLHLVHAIKSGWGAVQMTPVSRAGREHQPALPRLHYLAAVHS